MSGFKTSASTVSDKNQDTRFGFNPKSENWNGRFAMIGFVSIILIEALSGQGILHFWGIL
ncbi:high light inducible protein [Fortiea sp. LEGE XX443]|uniref:high light inducible protein n=1 Tax=Fortiea sp. LEGE XX443 TaxID=1828611 RepID=UPI001882EB4C|nr:high light inducible protein [Fortiea sp. LEGE XX443]MBE9008026.1 high light inducible protein [Fortiea sp. LEGE XX443]